MPRKKRRSRASVHAALLRRAHTDGTYERLYERAGGKCEICRCPPHADRRFDVDHRHTPGAERIRGLLCRGCNMKLRKGLTPAWLRAAADYLEQFDSAD